jgi:transcriptional regulator with XRE-family HTH domain
MLRVMDELLTPDDIERLAKLAGLTLKEVCSRAGIAQSTFSRWKAGATEPTLDVYRRLRDAVLQDAA